MSSKRNARPSRNGRRALGGTGRLEFPVASCCLRAIMVPHASALIPGLFVLIWATGFVAARFVAPHAEALTFVALRVVGVALVLALITRVLGARWPRDRAGWLHAGIAGVLMQGVYVIGVFWSVQHGLPAGIAALVGSLQPLLTATLAGPILGEAVSRRRWLGIGAGFSGALLVLAPKVGTSGSAGIPVPALAACLAAMVAMTGGTLWQKSRGGGADLLSNATIQFIGASVLAVPVALLFGTGRFDGSTPLWFGLAWSILINSVAGILLLLALIRRGAVAGVSALLFLVPPVSALMAYGLFGEALEPLQIGGMVLAALGVMIASRG